MGRIRFICIVLILLIVSFGSIAYLRYYNQSNWELSGKELFLNNLMENLRAQVKEDAGYVVEHPIVFDEPKVKVALGALSDEVLKKIRKRSPSPNENYNDWKLLSEEDPLASKTFYISRSINDRRVYIIWVKELQIPLPGSIFLTTWEHHGVWRKKEFLRNLLKIGLTNEEINKLWEEVSKRSDNGWL